MHKFVIIIKICILFCSVKALHKTPDLVPQQIITDHVTLSGFGSGGIMAQIMQISYSSFFKGVGIFSSSYYRCGPVSKEIENFNKLCTKLSKTPEDKIYDPDLVHKDMLEYSKKGYISDPKNLYNKRLYIYAGLRSDMFSPVQSLNALRVWERYIKNPYKIKTHVQDSGYVMPTNNIHMNNCTANAEENDYIANCGLIGAFEALKFLHADFFTIHHPMTPKEAAPLEHLRRFNQSVFLEGLTNHYMDDVGFYYVPSRCQIPTYPCLLHVFFHSCENGRNQSNANFIGRSGFLEVAEMNDIVMLFPQSKIPQLQNKKEAGCWDHFGIGGDLYATRKGSQVKAVWKIINAVIGVQTLLPIPNEFRPNNHRMYSSHSFK